MSDNRTPEDMAKRLEKLEREHNRHLRIMEVGLELASQMDMAELFPLVISHVTKLVEADRSSLFLHDEETDEIWTMVAEGLDTNQIRMPAGKGIIGKVCHTGEILNIPDAYDSPLFDQSWDRKTGYRTKSVLCVPLLNRKGQTLGALQVLNKKTKDVFDHDDEETLRLLSWQIAVYVENADLYARIEHLFDSIVAAISVAIDERDPVTAGHSRRVTEYALRIARKIHAVQTGKFKDYRFNRLSMKELWIAGLLHDFGKVAVPESILQKATRLPSNWINVISERLKRQELQQEVRILQDELNGKKREEEPTDYEEEIRFLSSLNNAGFLNDHDAAELYKIHEHGIIDDSEYEYLSVKKGTLSQKERDIMESHAHKTFTVLSQIPWPEYLQDVPKIASLHHETLDGTGYPHGIKDEEIPLGSKIIAVADIYDACAAQDRPYKPAIPHERTEKIIRSLADSGKLDQEIVNIFFCNKLYDAPIEGTRTAIFRRNSLRGNTDVLLG